MKITILRKWNHPRIEISMGSESIGITMSLDDFIVALTDEVAEPLVRQVVADAGNPTMWFTKAQMERNLVAAIEGDKAHTLFVEAAERIVAAMKQETIKVV